MLYVLLLILGSLLECNTSLIKDKSHDYGSPLPPIQDESLSKRGLTSLLDPVPSSGNQRLLVLTVGYIDIRGKYTGEEWRNGLFQEWINFFEAQSYKKLRYNVDVVTLDNGGNPVINDPTSKRYIPLTNHISKYANKQHGWDFSSPYSLHTIVKEACSFLDNKRFNWNNYLQNGTVQNILIMSAGYDYRYAQLDGKQNPEDDYLLSTSFSGVNYRTKTGAMINSYTFCSEHTQSTKTKPEMAHLGQCAHEFGHALGIPDLYDLSFKTSGVGYFDLLGYGVYANDYGDGSRPVGFGAWPKTALGWAEPQVIRGSTEIKLGATSLSPQNMLKVYPDPSSNDTYFLIETRQPYDKWDNNFISHYTKGVLIWIIHESDSKTYTPFNSINTYPTPEIEPCPAKPSVVVMEADGKQDMSTLSKNGKREYGDSDDVWEPGDQLKYSDKFSIGIMEDRDNIVTIRISFNGSINMSGAVVNNASSLLPLCSSSFSFFLPLLLLLSLLLSLL